MEYWVACILFYEFNQCAFFFFLFVVGSCSSERLEHLDSYYGVWITTLSQLSHQVVELTLPCEPLLPSPSFLFIDRYRVNRLLRLGN
uniref:Uncharacterized protein n=1 Tax=Daphnia magna TaxID=35525 RepID=A0A0N8CSD0_9CRUS